MSAVDERHQNIWAFVAALAVSLTGIVVVALLAPRPGPRLVLFPPAMAGDGGLAAVAAAGGLPLDSLWRGRAVLVRADDPAFAGRVLRNGAWLVLNAPLAGCSAKSSPLPNET